MSTGVAETRDVGEVTRFLRDNYHRLNTSLSFRRVVDMFLTSREKEVQAELITTSWQKTRTVELWMQLRHCSRDRAIIDLTRLLSDVTAAAEWMLRETGEEIESVEIAVRRFRLVVVESPREVYWDGVLIPIDWNRRSALWDYFDTLCRQAQMGQSADASHFGLRVRRKTLTNRKFQLLHVPGFPSGLGDQIVASGRQHRLSLNAEEMRIFALRTREVLEVQQCPPDTSADSVDG